MASDDDNSGVLLFGLNLSGLLKLASVVVAFVGVVFSVIIWIQTQGNDRYYQKLSGELLERELAEQKQDLIMVEAHLAVIERQNVDVIRALGNLECGSEVEKRR